MANYCRIYGFMKVIKKGSFTNRNCFLVPRSLSCFKFHSNSCSIDKVTNVFDRMIQTQPLPCVDKFTLLLDYVVTQIKHYSFSLDIFKQMCAIGIPLTNYSANIAINCYCRLQQTKHSFTILGCCFKQGIVLPHASTYNTILDGFIGEDKTHEAERLFKKLFNNDDQLLCEPDIVTYNTMIKGLCKVGNNFTAIALLRLMDGRGGCYKPDIVSYNTIIDSLCNDVVLMIDDAFKLFKDMVSLRGIRPDVVTYNSLIYALSKLGRWDEVCKMLKQMKDENISLDMRMCDTIVDALCKQGKLKEAETVILMMHERDEYVPDVVTYNSLIDGYCSRRQMRTAFNIFSRLETIGVKPNIFTYNKLIDGYLKDLKEDTAMIMCSVIPKKLLNKVTHFLFVGLITRTNHHHYRSKSGYKDCKCSYLYHLYMHGNSYESALELFHFMDGHKLNSNIEVYNILIFGANNCGKFDIARRLFHELTVKGLQPDDVTYTLIIRGFYQEGLFKDAKRMFVKMKKSGFLPDGVVDINHLPLCYLEADYFYKLACCLCDMSGRWYKTTPPLVATLLTSNSMDQFIYS